MNVYKRKLLKHRSSYFIMFGISQGVRSCVNEGLGSFRGANQSARVAIATEGKLRS